MPPGGRADAGIAPAAAWTVSHRRWTAGRTCSGPLVLEEHRTRVPLDLAGARLTRLRGSEPRPIPGTLDPAQGSPAARANLITYRERFHLRDVDVNAN
ncbi:hypothetical protein HBB16_01480 [Pseudonocardia sp. MCCB 268]|nr:hypothetical protein [Pseudonocardia cytotoxica]